MVYEYENVRRKGFKDHLRILKFRNPELTDSEIQANIPFKGPMCPDAKYDPEKSYPPQCRKQCTQPKDWDDHQKNIYDKACQAKKATVVKVWVLINAMMTHHL